MQRVILALLCATALTFVVARSPVRGQSSPNTPGPTTATPGTGTPAPTTTPTVTGTPTAPPSFQALTTGINSAIDAANTFHMSGTIGISLSGSSPGQIKGTLVGDASIKPLQLRETVRVGIPGPATSGTGRTLQTVTVVVGSKGAVRTGQTGWTCTNGAKATSAVGGNPIKISKIPKGYKVSMSVVGPVVINGLSAWDLRIRLSMKSKKQNIKGVIDEYADEGTNLPIRYQIAETASATGQKFAVSLIFDLSKYGEPVSIKLPAKCVGSRNVRVSQAMASGFSPIVLPLGSATQRQLSGLMAAAAAVSVHPAR